VPVNPAASVRGPTHIVKTGKTSVLSPEEARLLLDSIDVSTHAGLRDRALIALMVYSFARVGAALAMRVEDVFVQNSRLWIRLREKGGKHHEMPANHNLEVYLRAYLEGTGIAGDSKGPLFRTIGAKTGAVTSRPCSVQRARHGAQASRGRRHRHQDRQSHVSSYRHHRVFEKCGSLENAAAMANHASTRSAQLYDRRRDGFTLDEIERILV
jgi:integrase